MSRPERCSAGEIDHLVFGVADLDEAAHAYRHMGFVISPRAEHQALGTANHVFVFENTYCELLGVVRPEVAKKTVGGALAAGSGVSGLALCGVAGLAKSHYSASGISAGEPIDFSRDAEVAGEIKRARFRISRLEEGAPSGFFVFVCEHLTPELVWHPDAMAHPNGVTGIREVLVQAEDPARAAAAFECLCLGSVRTDGRFYEVALGVRLRFFKQNDLEDRYPGLSRPLRSGGEVGTVAARGVGVVFSTNSIERSIDHLVDAGIDYVSTGRNSVFVLPEHAGGVLVEFTQGS